MSIPWSTAGDLLATTLETPFSLGFGAGWTTGQAAYSAMGELVQFEATKQNTDSQTKDARFKETCQDDRAEQVADVQAHRSYSADKEAAVLVHETGHLLGLVDVPDHMAGAHCTHGECLMHNGISAASALALGWRTLLGSMPKRYCQACLRNLYGDDRLEPAVRADLERASP